MNSSDSSQSSFDLTGKRVVVVEDEGLTQLQLKKMLRIAGMEIVGDAANGAEGVDTVLATHPDIVLMDINMPIMNGLEASRRILSEFPACIVILTAYSQEEYVEEAEQLGVCGYVLKPVTRELLLPQLQKAFEKHEQQADEGEA